MAATDTDVRARVHSSDKEMATAVLNELGLNISDLIRMAIVQTARLKMLPFQNDSAAVKINLERTKKALASKTVKAPSGMSKEKMRQFILSHAD